MIRTLSCIASCLLFSVASYAQSCRSLAPNGEFEHDAGDWTFTGQIAVDPLNPLNHVAAVQATEPDVPSVSAPLDIPASVNAVQVGFRVLARVGLRLHFDCKLVLRIRLYDEKDNSRIQELEVKPSHSWRTMTVRFSSIAEFRRKVWIEALNSDGPFYLDDICVVAAQPNHSMQPTTGRRAAEVFMIPTSHPAATRALASGG